MADQITRKDVEILRAMRKDCRTPMGIIGEKLGMSKATVSRRVARMEDEKVITRYTVDLDSMKLGAMKSLVAIQVVGNPVSVVIEQLKEYPEVGSIYKSFGDHNIVCELYTKNVDELYEMIQTKLLKMPSVRNVEVDILIEKVLFEADPDLKLYLSTLPVEKKPE